MKSKIFMKIFNALSEYAYSQEHAEEMTYAVLSALNKE